MYPNTGVAPEELVSDESVEVTEEALNATVTEELVAEEEIAEISDEVSDEVLAEELGGEIV